MAVADASFKISTVSISFGLIKESALRVCFSSPPIEEGVVLVLPLLKGTPSITYNGSVPPKKELEPRILILKAAPGAPSFWVTFTPAILPCNACSTLVGTSFTSASRLIRVTAPVASFRFTVP